MRLEQIALNLLENAIRYTDEGRIDVYLHHSSTMLTLSIQDTGIGIPDDELPISSTVFIVSRSPDHGKRAGQGSVCRLSKISEGARRFNPCYQQGWERHLCYRSIRPSDDAGG